MHCSHGNHQLELNSHSHRALQFPLVHTWALSRVDIAWTMQASGFMKLSWSKS